MDAFNPTYPPICGVTALVGRDITRGGGKVYFDFWRCSQARILGAGMSGHADSFGYNWGNIFDVRW